MVHQSSQRLKVDVTVHQTQRMATSIEADRVSLLACSLLNTFAKSKDSSAEMGDIQTTVTQILERMQEKRRLLDAAKPLAPSAEQNDAPTAGRADEEDGDDDAEAI